MSEEVFLCFYCLDNRWYCSHRKGMTNGGFLFLTYGFSVESVGSISPSKRLYSLPTVAGVSCCRRQRLEATHTYHFAVLVLTDRKLLHRLCSFWRLLGHPSPPFPPAHAACVPWLLLPPPSSGPEEHLPASLTSALTSLPSPCVPDSPASPLKGSCDCARHPQVIQEDLPT